MLRSTLHLISEDEKLSLNSNHSETDVPIRLWFYIRTIKGCCYSSIYGGL